MELNQVSRLATTFTVDKAAKDLPYGTVEAIIATEDLDRHNEHMSIKGIEIPRDNYKAYYNHQYNGGTDLPVGIIESMRKSQGKLIGRIKLAVAEYPFADQLYKMIIGGFVDSMSIGFVPKEWDEATQTWTRSEFVEASFVAEPANVAARISAKGLDTAEADKLFALEKDFAQAVTADNTDKVKSITADLTALPLHDVKAVLENCKSTIAELDALVNTPAGSGGEMKHLIKLRLAGKKTAKQVDQLNKAVKVKLTIKQGSK